MTAQMLLIDDAPPRTIPHDEGGSPTGRGSATRRRIRDLRLPICQPVAAQLGTPTSP